MVAPYLGVLGSLQRLRYPARGYAPAVDLGASATTLLSGYKVVTRTPSMSRSFELEFNYLSDTERSVLRGIALGWWGLGPFAYVDPTETNLLEANVAASGMIRGTTRGWTAAGTGSTVTRAATGGSQGSGAILWAGSALAGTKTLTLGVRPFPVLPTSPAQVVTGSLYAKVAAGTLAASLDILWFDVNGGALTTSTQAITVTTTATRFSRANTTPPANAVSGQLRLSSSGVSFTCTIDGPQVEYAAAASTYLPGQPGVAWVVPMGWDPSTIAVGVTTGRLALQEVP